MSSRGTSPERSESRLVKHQHSFSESGRTSVPMWDSSDPDRAPPPLPLNPSVGSPITRSNTSARIEEAAALIQARARENAPSSYTSNPPPTPSPEKSPVKAQHRRMQTLQSNGVVRISDSLERRSPDKSLRPSKQVEFEDYRASRRDRSPARPESPTPTSRASKQVENTPPPSNMLALQTIRNRQESAPVLADITNNSTASPAAYSVESLSSQILNITSIATNLQREMTNLSKRSKDNATDLMDLRKATNSRDEDIRKSLRELVAGLDTKHIEPHHRLLGAPEATRSTPNLNLFLEDKSYDVTPRKNFTLPRIASPGFDRDLTASPSLACVDGAASIALLEKVLREMATKEGQATIKETLEAVRSQALVKIQSSASSSKVQSGAIDPIILAKLDEILAFMRQVQDESSDKASVPRVGSGERAMSQADTFLNSERGGQLSKERRMSMPAGGPEPVNEEVMKMLKNVKQSLTQGGGLTNEVKALVRELRGEVLGMGRDIAKKLENSQSTSRLAPQAEQGPDREEIATIVDQALAELKEHMHEMVRENKRQSAGSTQPGIDTSVVVHAVKSAIAQMPIPQQETPRDVAGERDEIIAAVREAWEDCKPEIALEHFGLERDEILETLKEGLKSHHSQSVVENAGATYEEVLEAVRKGMADFKPPTIDTQESVTRDEIFAAVKEVLENFDWPTPSMLPSSLGTGSDMSGMSRQDISEAIHEAMVNLPPMPTSSVSELSRREIVDAVQEGMTNQPPVTKEVEFNREDLFDAVKSCLEGEQNPLGGMGERVVEAMHEFLGSMKTEFKEYSTANGKDTEQVLDALKDGLEDLRADVESYVDRASDVTGKDEIIETVKAGFAAVQVDLDRVSSRPNNSAANTPELLDAMEREFEHLRDTIGKSMTKVEMPAGNDEILDAIRDMQDDRQSALSSNSEDIVRLVKEELEHMRATLAGTLIKSGSSIQRDDVVDAVREAMESNRSVPRPDGNESILSNTSELLDAFQDGVDNIRTDLQKLMDRPADVSSTYEVLDTLKIGIEDVRADIGRLEKLHADTEQSTSGNRAVVVHDENMIQTEIEGLKVMITQLRIKVEALDSMPAPTVEAPREMRVHKDDLDDIHVAIQGVHATVRDVKNAPKPEVLMPINSASKDDTDAIETLLRNMKAKIDDLPDLDTASFGKSVQLEAMEDMLRDVKVAVEEIGEKASDSGKAGLDFVELMLKDVQKSVEDIQHKMAGLNTDDGILSKSEIIVVESLCADIKSQIDGLALPDVDSLPTRDDVNEVRDSIKAFQEQLEADNELTAQAFEARKIEHGGLANKIDDVKGVIGDLRDELMNKLDGSEEGIVELNKVLGMHHDGMSLFATAASVTDLSDLVKAEFEKQAEHHVTRKGDLDEHSATLFNKHEETSAELKAAIGDKFNELMIKYDDAQASSDIKLRGLDENCKNHAEAMTGTKAVVDDLKSVMETLGATITETCEGVSADSKTVFSKVDETSTKIEELHTVSALEHGQTRDEVIKALAAATRLEGTIADNHPTILAAIREVLDAVSQHFAHSQQQTESFERATEEIKSNVGSIPTSITSLLPAPTVISASPEVVREIPIQPAYDDSQVHDKLNNLISHAATAKEMFSSIGDHHKSTQESLGGLEKLDQIHETVMTAATEISAMVATQSRLMAEHHDSKTQEATEAAIALEKRTAQKESVEADIVRLSEEKNALMASMQELRREQDELSGQTKRLTREVGKLETALTIRQEEMRDMNSRAETLERRIFEGLMDHARTVKESKLPTRKRVTPQERDASMSLKRVPSSASTATATTTRTSVRDNNSTLGSAVGMALKKRAPLGHSNTVSSRASGVDRRILSTSHVTGNRGRETLERQLVLAPAPKASGFTNLKRSHSVKSNPGSHIAGRKPTWNGLVTLPIENKENDHPEEEEHDQASGDEHSEAGTERRSSATRTSLTRTSLGTSYMYTDSLSYGTGSDLSTRSGRTVSYASSIGGTLNGGPESIAEEEEDEFADTEDHHHALALAEPTPLTKADMKSNDTALTPFDSYDTVIPSQQEETVQEQDSPSFEPPSNDMTAQAEDEYLSDDAVPVEAAEVISELAPPPLITEGGMKYSEKYNHSNVNGSDSGLGTEPPTAMEEHPPGEAMEYFQMTQQETRT